MNYGVGISYDKYAIWNDIESASPWEIRKKEIFSARSLKMTGKKYIHCFNFSLVIGWADLKKKILSLIYLHYFLFLNNVSYK